MIQRLLSASIAAVIAAAPPAEIGGVIAAEPTPGTQSTPIAREKVRMSLCDGRTIEGELQSLDAEQAQLSTAGEVISVNTSEIRNVAWGAAGTSDSTQWLLFANGDRARLRPLEMSDDHFVCRWESAPDWPTWRIPMERVAGVVLRPLDAPDDAQLLRELGYRTFDDDVLVLSDRTRLEGVLDALDLRGVRVETTVGVVEVAIDRLHALALNSALLESSDSQQAAAVLELADGSWLTLEDVRISGSQVTAVTGFGTFSFPAEAVRGLSLFGPRVADLTRREPLDVSSTPFLSRELPMLVNRNVRGGFLSLDGRAFPRGFGMTSGMDATFPLEPEDQRFQALIGLDDEAGEGGSAVFTVDLDGRTIFTSPPLTGRDAPLLIEPLDVAGGRQLRLSVDFAEFGNVQDVANWCNPVLLR